MGRALCAGLLLLSCRDKTATAEKSKPAPSLVPAPKPSESVATRAPDPGPSAEASALPPLPPPPATIVASSLAIEPVLTGDERCSYELHNPRGAVVVARCAELLRLSDGKLVPSNLPETGLAVDSFNQTQGAVQAIHRVSGRWPDALVIELTRLDEMQSDRGAYFSPQDSAYELVGGRWREIGREDTPQAAAWSQGRTLLHRQNEFELMAGRKDLPLPQKTPVRRSCSHEVSVTDFTAMTDGTVVSVGCDCEDPRALRAEIIAEGKPAVIYTLATGKTLPEKVAPRLVGDAPSALFVTAPSPDGVVLWRYRSDGFEEISLPSHRPLAAAHATPDGHLWLSFVGPSKNKGKAEPAEIFRRTPAGVWEPVTLPSAQSLKDAILAQWKDANTGAAPELADDLRFLPRSIASFAEGEVWLAGTIVSGVDREEATVLARASGAGPVTSAPAIGWRPGPEFPEPYRKDCESPFVLLYAVAEQVPKDYEFPATRDAVRGTRFVTSARFVEFRHKDKRTLGALVGSAAEGKALIEQLQAGVRGSKPVLMCFAPKSVEREVSFK
jgi:hypothetical protein